MILLINVVFIFLILRISPEEQTKFRTSTCL